MNSYFINISTAKKEHTCCQCKSTIAIGDVYVIRTAKPDYFSNKFYTHKACSIACLNEFLNTNISLQYRLAYIKKVSKIKGSQFEIRKNKKDVPCLHNLLINSNGSKYELDLIKQEIAFHERKPM